MITAKTKILRKTSLEYHKVDKVPSGGASEVAYMSGGCVVIAGVVVVVVVAGVATTVEEAADPNRRFFFRFLTFSSSVSVRKSSESVKRASSYWTLDFLASRIRGVARESPLRRAEDESSRGMPRVRGTPLVEILRIMGFSDMTRIL